MTTGDDGGSGIDFEKVGHVRYDLDDELLDMTAAYASEREQFPIVRRDLRLNERGGLFRWLGIFQIVSLEDAIDRLAVEAGPECDERVLEFGVHRYPHLTGESRRENDWRRLFSKLVFGWSRQYPMVEPALAPAVLDTVHREVRRHIDPDLNQRSIDDDRAPLTPWDEVVYARCDGWSPFDVMSELSYHFQVQAAWQAIEAALTPDEVAALVDWVGARRPCCQACGRSGSRHPDTPGRCKSAVHLPSTRRGGGRGPAYGEHRQASGGQYHARLCPLSLSFDARPSPVPGARWRAGAPRWCSGWAIRRPT